MTRSDQRLTTRTAFPHRPLLDRASSMLASPTSTRGAPRSGLPSQARVRTVCEYGRNCIRGIQRDHLRLVFEFPILGHIPMPMLRKRAGSEVCRPDHALGCSRLVAAPALIGYGNTKTALPVCIGRTG